MNLDTTSDLESRVWSRGSDVGVRLTVTCINILFPYVFLRTDSPLERNTSYA